MKPKNSPQAVPSQLNPDHPLVRFADTIRWSRFEEAYGPLDCEENVAPGLPTRLMVGLEYLKYTYNLFDEELVVKDRIRYGFGNKASVVTTNNRSWVVSRPYFADR